MERPNWLDLPGWQPEIPFEEQVGDRVNDYAERANSAISAAVVAFGREMTKLEVGRTIREFALVLADNATSLSLLRFVIEPTVWGIGEEFTGLPSKTLWTTALQYASKRVTEFLADVMLPAFILGRGPARFVEERRVIIVPPGYAVADVMLGGQQVLDRLGRTAKAAAFVRDWEAEQGSDIITFSGRRARRGRWIDANDGILEAGDVPVPYLDNTAARFGGSLDQQLAEMWTASPRQVGLYLATMSGAWM